MKKLILIITIVFSGMLMQGQELNDIDIALAVMGNNPNELDAIADSLNISITYDGNDKLFVSYDGTTKYFKIGFTYTTVLISPGKRKLVDGIGSVFIRYSHKLHNHFTQFKAAEIPDTSSIYNFEKKQGRNVSHIKITYI